MVFLQFVLALAFTQQAHAGPCTISGGNYLTCSNFLVSYLIDTNSKIICKKIKIAHGDRAIQLETKSFESNDSSLKIEVHEFDTTASREAFDYTITANRDGAANRWTEVTVQDGRVVKYPCK